MYSKGAFNFSQATLPLLLASTSSTTTTEPRSHLPTLIFIGATASVKGSALFAAFAPMKFALRALAQCLAREMGPKGVHVAHAVIDGVIDIERTKGWELAEGGKIDPGAVSFFPFSFSSFFSCDVYGGFVCWEGEVKAWGGRGKA